jgi:hypothetical protein
MQALPFFLCPFSWQRGTASATGIGSRNENFSTGACLREHYRNGFFKPAGVYGEQERETGGGMGIHSEGNRNLAADLVKLDLSYKNDAFRDKIYNFN